MVCLKDKIIGKKSNNTKIIDISKPCKKKDKLNIKKV